MTPVRTENTFPSDPPWIRTSTVKLFEGFAHLLMNVEKSLSMMGVLTGVAGIGKTVALHMYHKALEQEPASPKCISLRVKPRATPRMLATQMLEAIGEPLPSSSTKLAMMDATVQVMKQHNLRLFILDEADSLDGESIKMVQSVFDSTGCPILLIGLPGLWEKIALYDQLVSRIGVRMKVPSLTFDEVLHVLLPDLVFPGWVFNPADEADCSLAEEIWQQTCPSLRRLTHVLVTASHIAHIQHRLTITRECIRRALQMVVPPDTSA